MQTNWLDICLKKISSLYPQFIHLSLERVLNLLNKCGNPHHHLPPIIHVAGTNGKGSVLAFCQSILQEANFTVHKYTSPHLIRFNERIIVAGKEVEDYTLYSIFKDVLKLNKNSPITPFEFITVASFLLFSQHKADVLLLETGLGGRLDATNVITSPLISAITTISHDHNEFLGHSLKEIAIEKAGIIKKNYPVVIGPQNKVVNNVLREVSQNSHSPAYFYDQDWYLLPKKTEISLMGKHQRINASMAAFMMLKQQSFAVSMHNITNGLKKTSWHARLQKVNDDYHHNFEIFIDSAHNEGAVEALMDEIKNWKDQNYHVVGVLALKKRKNIFKIMNQLKNCLDFLILSSIRNTSDGENASPRELLSVCKKLHINADIDENFSSILSNIHNKFEVLGTKKNRVIFFGSIYFINEFLNYHDNV